MTRAATRILAPNPGPMTLDGTNTWLVGRPGSRDVVVVDPGPDDAAHLASVVALASSRGARVRQILLTHGHLDHSAGARSLHDLTGAPVRALDPAHVLGGEGLRAGDVVAAGEARLDVVATPGHTADSLSFVLVEHDNDPPSVLTGDTVLGRGTSVVAHPDGRLDDYLVSLRRLRELARTRPLGLVLPGHGPVLPDAGVVLEAYERHRLERLAQVRRAVAEGARSPADVVRLVYVDLDPSLVPAAERSVAAQLAYLRG